MRVFKNSGLIETLKNLANDQAKYKNKKEKKHQRSSFRDILKTIEQGEFDTQAIKFGNETLYLDNWLRKKQYDAFKELIGNRMNIHLQENEFLRDIFELGPPQVSSDASKTRSMQMTSREKAQFNKEQFRHRTKAMNKKRETKDVISGGGGGDGGDGDDY